MIRWLLIALFIYILYKLITGQRARNKNQKPNSFFGSNGSEQKRRRKNLDHIEEAEFEDITHKEKKGNEP
ncbi:hypothetical protein [Rhodohalobacter mucosus]|uniref:DUF4834 domain-containing protein n=1 Tax=Rhodohalobacter mucosus TaxID=2079485 RepID=A0A316TMK6_9BACT|nr:hypothetical protein [Rhodohalobacter mucosus]PWN05837.1 hypothetical protein DDZ15_11650 [Rhodohalobacter mucosus]